MKKLTFLFVLISFFSFSQTNTSTKEVFKSKDGKLYIKQTNVTFSPVSEDFIINDADTFYPSIPQGVSTQVKLDSINAQLKRYKIQSDTKDKENAEILSDLKSNGWVSRQERQKKEELERKIKEAKFFNSVNKVKN